MAAPDVTVVIPAYNPGPMLGEAVASVMAQTYPGWRVLIVDDGSSQHLLDYLPHDLRPERFTLVHHASNQGQGAALNTALRHVETPYFLQLDADDLFPPDTIRRLHDTLEKSPASTALVTGNMQMVFGGGEPPVLRKGNSFNDRYQLLLRNQSLWPRFYRTAALRRVGGWPVDGPFQGRYLEDRQMLYRLIEAFDFAWVDEVLYICRRHGGNMTMQHADLHNPVASWLIGDCLKRWGNRFRPVFCYDQDVLLLARLIPLRPRLARGSRRARGVRRVRRSRGQVVRPGRRRRSR